MIAKMSRIGSALALATLVVTSACSGSGASTTSTDSSPTTTATSSSSTAEITTTVVAAVDAQGCPVPIGDVTPPSPAEVARLLTSFDSRDPAVQRSVVAPQLEEFLRPGEGRIAQVDMVLEVLPAEDSPRAAQSQACGAEVAAATFWASTCPIEIGCSDSASLNSELLLVETNAGWLIWSIE